MILITHDDGGGVERQVGVSAAAHRAAGLRPIVLRPAQEPDGPVMVAIDGAAAGFPNLRYALPQETPELLRVLRATNPRLVEVHHTLHHPPAIYDLVACLGLPYDVHVHDYAWFCPQVSLVGSDRRYCGEPAVIRCEACVADAGRIIDEAIGVQALRDRSAAFLAVARRVVAPSADAAARMRRHFPQLRPAIVPLEDDGEVADPPRPRARSGACRVCVLGAISVHKGYDVLLACARDAAERKPTDGVRRGRPHLRRRPPAGDRPRVRHRPVRGRGGGAADPRPGCWCRTAALGLAGDVELRPDRVVACRSVRGGIRFRRASRTDPPHRPRISIADRAAAAWN